MVAFYVCLHVPVLILLQQWNHQFVETLPIYLNVSLLSFLSHVENLTLFRLILLALAYPTALRLMFIKIVEKESEKED